MDPIGTLSGGLSIGQGILQFLGYIKNIARSDVISAFFDWNGERTTGSDKIEIEKHPQENSAAIWWYSVKPLSEYTFVRIPVVGSGIQELIGTVVGEENDDARFWRWVALPKPNVIVGGNYDPPNAKVDFIVVVQDFEARTRSEFGVRGHDRVSSGNHAVLARDVGCGKCETGNR